MGLLWRIIFFFSAVSAWAANPPRSALLYDALLARVGREAVLLSDLSRFREVEKVMLCSGLRSKGAKKGEQLKETLDRFVEEELIYQEARAKKIPATKLIPNAVQVIRGKEECLQSWQRLGEKFSGLWGTKARPAEGEEILILELEKRLLVDRFLRSDAVSDRSLWVREAKAKTQVVLYLDDSE